MGLFGFGKKHKDGNDKSGQSSKTDAKSARDDMPPAPPLPQAPKAPSAEKSTSSFSSQLTDEDYTPGVQHDPFADKQANTAQDATTSDDGHLPDLPDAPPLPRAMDTADQKQELDEVPTFPGFELPPLDDDFDEQSFANTNDSTKNTSGNDTAGKNTDSFFSSNAKPSFPDIDELPKKKTSSAPASHHATRDDPMLGSTLVEGSAVRFDKKSGNYFFGIDDFRVIRNHVLKIDEGMQKEDALMQVERKITVKEAELLNALNENVTVIQQHLSRIHDMLFEG